MYNRTLLQAKYSWQQITVDASGYVTDCKIGCKLLFRSILGLAVCSIVNLTRSTEFSQLTGMQASHQWWCCILLMLSICMFQGQAKDRPAFKAFALCNT
jgi:hypothetical protein